MLNKFTEDEKEQLNNYIQQLIEIGIMYLNKESYDRLQSKKRWKELRYMDTCINQVPRRKWW